MRCTPWRLPLARMARSRRMPMAMAVEEPDTVRRAAEGGFLERRFAANAATAAITAAQAVSEAVAMRELEAPDVDKSFIAQDIGSERVKTVDEEGLPLVYDKALIEKYWKAQGSALQQRWTEFLGLSVPFLTKMVGMLITGGTGELQKNEKNLAEDARIIIEKLGPTYIKGGQMMSVRPDVLSQPVLEELSKLQDAVKPFNSSVAIAQIERELGQPLGAVFTEISEEPVAAASLAQVYKAKLAATGEWVAVKIQRPSVLSVVSKDLYVLRRAAEVYQGLMERFAPRQRTNYVGLLNEWAIGFYTELDFTNEAKNQMKMRELLDKEDVSGVYVPQVYEDLCTRRLLVTEWIDGKKLSQCEPKEVRELIEVGQECFLTQLLKVGFFHADPHPGNLMRVTDEVYERTGCRLALLDFGLVAQVQAEDRDVMINAVIHLANKDYAALVDDFINLGVLPVDCDRPKVIPLMDKALSPYVKGGGAKRYEEEVRKMYGMDGSVSGSVGGFQAMTQDALTVLNDIPFSIPPYFALLGRAIVTLEGVALSGNPNYGIIMEAYPFVARELLNGDRPQLQQALQELLYGGRLDGEGSKQLQGRRLASLLNNAMGVVARKDGEDAAFVDLEAIPEDGVTSGDAVRYLLGRNATSLRNILRPEVENAFDLLSRQALRKTYTAAQTLTPGPLRSLFRAVVDPQDIPVPVPVPLDTGYTVQLLTPKQILEIAAPKLSREEELYAIALIDLAKETFGEDAAKLLAGDGALDPISSARFIVNTLSSALGTGRNPSGPIPAFASTDNAGSSGPNSNLVDAIGALTNLNDDETQELRTLAGQLFDAFEGNVRRRFATASLV
eukprot:scaffold48_cov311-Pinguiococcus_pyrenoidosus.AAC.76